MVVVKVENPPKAAMGHGIEFKCTLPHADYMSEFSHFPESLFSFLATSLMVACYS